MSEPGNSPLRDELVDKEITAGEVAKAEFHPLRKELAEKRIIDFTPEELFEAGFEGEGVPEWITAAIDGLRKMPHVTHSLKGSDLYYRRVINPRPTPPNISPSTSIPSDWSQVTVTSDSALTVVGDNLVSDFEKYNYYIGLCANDNDVPLLLYRTSLESAPFPAPAPGAKTFNVPNKTAHGTAHPVLTINLWRDTVGPKIMEQVLDPAGIKYTSVMRVRFATCDEDGKSTFGPLVIWIMNHPGTTSPERARQVSPAILDILADHGVTGAEVEWCECIEDDL